MSKLSEKYAKRSDLFGRLYRYAVKVKLYFKFPDSFVRDIKIVSRRPEAKRLGIGFHSPNFIFRSGLNSNSIIVDVGCGYEADFSRFMMANFGAQCFGIDPTEKHKNALMQLAAESEGRFEYFQNAVSSKSGEMQFYEIENRESGSLLADHTNIMKDVTISYVVRSVTLREIPKMIDHENIDLIKLDIEGAEYDLFENITIEDLNPYHQIYIEFHHKSVKSKSFRDTEKVIRTLRENNFSVFSMDDLNFLFFRE
jgi:FkbM family methyltransferase